MASGARLLHLSALDPAGRQRDAKAAAARGIINATERGRYLSARSMGKLVAGDASCPRASLAGLQRRPRAQLLPSSHFLRQPPLPLRAEKGGE